MARTSAPASPRTAGIPAAAAAGLEGIAQLQRPRLWLERFSRLGLVVRGFIYFVPGVFALQWAMGGHSRSMTQTGAIEWISHQPLGRSLLVVVAVGLAGYVVWGGLRAILDVQHRGHSPGGIALRVGYVGSAIAYLGLLLVTVGLLTGTPSHSPMSSDWTTKLLAHPFGGIAVVGIGLCWVFGSGIAQIVLGWRHGFERDLKVERMSRLERRWAIGLGRVGLVARGLVFTLIGVLLIAMALNLKPGSSAGLGGALLELARQPFGRTLLGAAGLGLMTFGAYSAMCARWMRMHRTASASTLHSMHPNAP